MKKHAVTGSASTEAEGGLTYGAQTVMQQVGSADLLCNSPAGVIKSAVTKTLKGDQEGRNGQLSRRGRTIMTTANPDTV